MVSINIGNGQGITYAIRDAIGAKNIKNKDSVSYTHLTLPTKLEV